MLNYKELFYQSQASIANAIDSLKRAETMTEDLLMIGVVQEIQRGLVESMVEADTYVTEHGEEEDMWKEQDI